MSFLQTIARSIYSPAFYATLPGKPFESGLGYFLLLALLLTIPQVAISAGMVLTIWDTVRAGGEAFANAWPDDLVVHLRGGLVSTNVEEPYVIRMPAGSWGNDPDAPRNAVIIDTKTPFSAAGFDDYDTLAWVTRDAVIVGEGINTRVMDLALVDDVTVDKEAVDGVVAAVLPWIRWVGPVLVVLLSFGIYLLYAVRLLYLLALGLAIWLLSVIFKWGLGYGESYKVGLYAMTPALLVELAVKLTESSTGFHGFPFMFTVVTLAALIANMVATRRILAGQTGTVDTAAV